MSLFLFCIEGSLGKEGGGRVFGGNGIRGVESDDGAIGETGTFAEGGRSYASNQNVEESSSKDQRRGLHTSREDWVYERKVDPNGRKEEET